MLEDAKNKHEIIEGFLAGGLIGASLGAILTGKKKETIVASLVGAAIGASIIAQKEAESLTTPIMYEENGRIYKRYANGSIEFVKDLPKSRAVIPSTFSIG